MKELTIEEKAARYDEAIDIARKINSGEGVAAPSGWTTCEVIFPELAESEDERIRKHLIKHFGNKSKTDWNGMPVDKIIAWLEKQGKQKPADKVEQKFEIGDWVVYDHRAYQVVELPKESYINLGLRRNGKIEFAPSTYCRHWTIQDAKNGDVLVAENGWTCIFKELKGENFSSFCFMDSGCYFHEGSECHTTDERICGKMYPATKEQRDTLMKAMADAGYTFDFEKKELKKIEPKKDVYNKLTDFETSLKHIMEEAIECGDTHNLKADADMLLRLVQKPAWSEMAKWQKEHLWKPADGNDLPEYEREVVVFTQNFPNDA